MVSIGEPARTANQKSIITPRGDAVYAIRPAHNLSLTLAASRRKIRAWHEHRARAGSRRAVADLGTEEKRGWIVLPRSQARPPHGAGPFRG